VHGVIGRRVISPQAHARHVDAVVTRQVPNVHKAVSGTGPGTACMGSMSPNIETPPDVISWFDIEDRDGKEMRWRQVQTQSTCAMVSHFKVVPSETGARP
jgi:hypothetical protein